MTCKRIFSNGLGLPYKRIWEDETIKSRKTFFCYPFYLSCLVLSSYLSFFGDCNLQPCMLYMAYLHIQSRFHDGQNDQVRKLKCVSMYMKVNKDHHHYYYENIFHFFMFDYFNSKTKYWHLFLQSKQICGECRLHHQHISHFVVLIICYTFQ